MFVSSFCNRKFADYVFHGFMLGSWKAACLADQKAHSFCDKTNSTDTINMNEGMAADAYGCSYWTLVQ